MGDADYGRAREVTEALQSRLIDRIVDHDGVSRRTVLGGLGVAGAGALGLSGSGSAAAAGDHDDREHGNFGARGEYDDVGFDPHAFLRTFHTADGDRNGVEQRTFRRDGRRVREFELVAVDTTITIAPGVEFDAWAFNGTVPGPTLRVTEGDVVRVIFRNEGSHAHTIHPHLRNVDPRMDGVPTNGPGVLERGEEFVYEWEAQPSGTHFYHCHSLPLKEHIHRGLYGTVIVDPDPERVRENPAAYVPYHESMITPALRSELVERAKSLNHEYEENDAVQELVMVMNGFDTNFDGDNEVYAVNTKAFCYGVGKTDGNGNWCADGTGDWKGDGAGDRCTGETSGIRPIAVDGQRPVRVYLLNAIEFDPINSFHTHSQFFDYYDHGTSLVPTHDTVDTVMQCQAQRGIVELDYSDHEPGLYMFHAHQSEFAELGWMSFFEVV